MIREGHLLAKIEGENQLLFGQVPFVSDRFLDGFLKIIKQESGG